MQGAGGGRGRGEHAEGLNPEGGETTTRGKKRRKERQRWTTAAVSKREKGNREVCMRESGWGGTKTAKSEGEKWRDRLEKGKGKCR